MTRKGDFIYHFNFNLYSFNKRIRQLDVFGTVNEMRAQRIKMVQKPEQYVYIFKCIRDEIIINEGKCYEV